MFNNLKIGRRADRTKAFGSTRRAALAALLLSLGAAGFSGCASMNAQGTEKYLTAAGFQQRSPSTPQQKEFYDKMKPYKLQQSTFNGKTLYAFKDEKQGVIYIGNDKQYQDYQRMVSEGVGKAQRMSESQQLNNAVWGMDF